MRRGDLIVVAILLVFGGFIAYQVVVSPRWQPTAAVETANVTTVAAGATSPNEVVVAASGLPAPERNVDFIRQRLQQRAAGTFINDILVARDSLIARWPDRRARPVTVWIDEASPLAGPQLDLATNVRRAFADWGQAGVPLVFNYTGNREAAEIKVTFVENFAERMSGLTLWTRDVHGWILGGDIQLALRSYNGQLLNNEQLYAIALHEAGHMLGLDHASDAGAIMAPRVRALALTPADVATMQLIYEFPPGSVKAGAK